MIEKLIRKIAKSLDKERISYMIIGGQAVLLYGTPRLTRDIDITLGIDTDEFEAVKAVCKRANLLLLPEDPENFAKDTKVLPAQDVKLIIRVDFIFSFTPYEKQAIKRTKKVMIAGYPVRFASCEDVIIHKMIAARAIDHEDVRNVLLKNKNTLNIEYINNWLAKFNTLSGLEDIADRFNNLINKLHF
ncbi:MAG: nucleotidyl transferase AbiEii/AbiGii toxin family protein [Candidatus Omnitrophota bacterium]